MLGKNAKFKKNTFVLPFDQHVHARTVKSRYICRNSRVFSSTWGLLHSFVSFSGRPVDPILEGYIIASRAKTDRQSRQRTNLPWAPQGCIATPEPIFKARSFHNVTTPTIATSSESSGSNAGHPCPYSTNNPPVVEESSFTIGPELPV